MTNRQFKFTLLLGAALLSASERQAQAQQYSAHYAYQVATPSAQAAPSGGYGCYTNAPPSTGACYTIIPVTTGNSCYTPTMQPGCPTYTQVPATPCYDVLCHDTAVVREKVTLRRYYPVFIHLQEKTYEGVEIQEEWNPICVLCTRAKPCPKHVN